MPIMYSLVALACRTISSFLIFLSATIIKKKKKRGQSTSSVVQKTVLLIALLITKVFIFSFSLSNLLAPSCLYRLDWGEMLKRNVLSLQYVRGHDIHAFPFFIICELPWITRRDIGTVSLCVFRSVFLLLHCLPSKARNVRLLRYLFRIWWGIRRIHAFLERLFPKLDALDEVVKLIVNNIINHYSWSYQRRWFFIHFSSMHIEYSIIS